MAMIELAVSIVLLMLAWRAWRAAVIDHGRDLLFDIRDNELRPKYLDGTLGQQEYEFVRARINASIRYLDRASFAEMLWMGLHLPELMRIRQDMARLGRPEPELSAFGRELLQKAGNKVVTHSVLTSMLGCIFLVVALAARALMRAFRAIAPQDTVGVRPVAAAAMSVLLALSFLSISIGSSGARQQVRDTNAARMIVDEIAHSAV
jgi:hypothetical protein